MTVSYILTRTILEPLLSPEHLPLFQTYILTNIRQKIYPVPK